MEDPNLALIADGLERFSAGDWRAVFERLDPDIEWVVAKEHPNPRTLHGRDEVRAYFDDWREMVGDFTMHLDEARPVGDGRYVLFEHMRGQGTTSGVELDVALAFVTTVRDGVITRVEEYLDRDEALTAAGLS
jgi:ketosteroid isomerase-like protein